MRFIITRSIDPRGDPSCHLAFSCRRRAPSRLHADRIAGGDRDHRGPDRPAAARRPGGPRGGPAGPVHQQPQAARPGLPQLRERQRARSRSARTSQVYIDPAYSLHDGWSAFAAVLAYTEQTSRLQRDQLPLRPDQLRNSTACGHGDHTLWCPSDAHDQRPPFLEQPTRAGTDDASAHLLQLRRDGGDELPRRQRPPSRRRARHVPRHRQRHWTGASSGSAGHDRRDHRRHQQHVPLRRAGQGKFGQVRQRPPASCQRLGWWTPATTATHLDVSGQPPR